MSTINADILYYSKPQENVQDYSFRSVLCFCASCSFRSRRALERYSSFAVLDKTSPDVREAVARRKEEKKEAQTKEMLGVAGRVSISMMLFTISSIFAQLPTF